MKSKSKLYFLSVLALTLLLSVLRTACFLTSYESDVGYFASTPTTAITAILYILATAWCLAAPLLFPKNSLPRATPSVTRNLCAMLAGSLFLFSGLCLGIGALASASSLRLVIGCLAVSSSVFFFTDGTTAPKRRTMHATFGFATLAFLFVLLFYVYFDMYVAINSPIKNALQLSILSAMLLVLYEIRKSIDRPRSRLSLPIRLLCALVCLPTAVSHLIFERSPMCRTLEKDLLSPFFSLALLGIGLFALVSTAFEKETEVKEKKISKTS